MASKLIQLWQDTVRDQTPENTYRFYFKSGHAIQWGVVGARDEERAHKQAIKVLEPDEVIMEITEYEQGAINLPKMNRWDFQTA